MQIARLPRTRYSTYSSRKTVNNFTMSASVISLHAWEQIEENLLVEFLHHKLPEENLESDTWAQLAERMNNAVRERGLQCRKFNKGMVKQHALKYYLDKNGCHLVFTEAEKSLVRDVIPVLQSSFALEVVSGLSDFTWMGLAGRLNKAARDCGLVCRNFDERDARAIYHEVTGMITSVFPVLPGDEWQHFTSRQHSVQGHQSSDMQQTFESQQPSQKHQFDISQQPHKWRDANYLLESSELQQVPGSQPLLWPSQLCEQRQFLRLSGPLETQQPARNEQSLEWQQPGIDDRRPVGLGIRFESPKPTENKQPPKGWEEFLKSEPSVDSDLPFDWDLPTELPNTPEEPKSSRGQWFSLSTAANKLYGLSRYENLELLFIKYLLYGSGHSRIFARCSTSGIWFKT